MRTRGDYPVVRRIRRLAGDGPSRRRGPGRECRRNILLGCAPEAIVPSSVASGDSRTMALREGGRHGEIARLTSWEGSKTPTCRSTRQVGKGPAWIFVHRHEPAEGPAKSNRRQPRGCKSTVRGRANTPRRVAGEKSDRKWIKTCKTACARAQKNQRTRQRGGAHPPERHQPPDQDSEHSRRPPRVPQVPYMQRVVVHGGLVGLHTRAQRDRHQKPRGFRVPLGLRRLRPARRGRGLRN